MTSPIAHVPRRCALLLAGGLVLASALSPVRGAAGAVDDTGLRATVTFDPDLLDAAIEGRAILLVSTDPDPLSVDVTDASTSIFGLSVPAVDSDSTILFEGAADPVRGAYGFSKADSGLDSVDDLAPGDYYVQAVFKRYESVTRSDGSTLAVHFPCGDGGTILNSPGNLISGVEEITIGVGRTDVELELDEAVEPSDPVPAGGTCQQGNPTAPLESGDLLRYEKVRSETLSDFWNRDIYIGANVVLPAGYDDPANASKQYPVIYAQSHWPGDNGAFGYPYNTGFRSDWDDGRTPEVILVTLRMETPFYDTSYGVNSANQGPWGDAIADELIPYLDETYRTIPERWARAQTGGSTGGWMSTAMTIYRPDLYGSAWSEYPDSLDFNAHQAVDLYDGENAYYGGTGEEIGSWHYYDEAASEDHVLVTMGEENRYELALGEGSRSFDQWDVWNATWSPQGSNGLPLDPWNKLTGEIDHDATELWRPFDMSDYLESNWAGSKQLGEVLNGRLHVWVGTQDTFYLNRGVTAFDETVTRLGGDGWAQFTYGEGKGHGYTPYPSNTALVEDIYDFMIADRDDGIEGEGTADLQASVGNSWSEVLAHGGHAAALRRAGALTIAGLPKVGATLKVSSDGFDSGTDVIYQWLRDGSPIAGATSSTYVIKSNDAGHAVAVRAVGRKIAYADKTLTSASADVPSISGSSPLTIKPRITKVGKARVGRVVAIRARAVTQTGESIKGLQATFAWRSGGRLLGTRARLHVPRRALGKKLTVVIKLSAGGAESVVVRKNFGKVRR